MKSIGKLPLVNSAILSSSKGKSNLEQCLPGHPPLRRSWGQKVQETAMQLQRWYSSRKGEGSL